MIKSIFRFFVLGFFVLWFSIQTNAEESESLYSAVSNIESYQATISDILPYLWQQAEDIIARIDSHSYNGLAFNIYSDQLELALDGTRPFYTQDHQLYDEFRSYYEDFLFHMEGIATILTHLENIPESNISIDNNISSIMSQFDSFSSQFTFNNGDLNVYDQRLAGLIQELKQQSGEHHDIDNEQIRQLGQSIANGFKELGETIRDSSSSSPADNFLTQPQLEETYEENKIFKFFNASFDIANIPFSPFFKYTNNEVDKDLETSFEIEELTPSFEVNDIFSLLASAIEYQSKIAAADNKSLILISKILKGDNHDSDKEEIENELNEVQSKKQELLSELEDIAKPIKDEINVQNNKLKNFDFSLSTLSDISSINLPTSINLGDLPISHIFGIDLTEYKRQLQSLDITSFHPMIETCRICSEVILYVFLGLFFLWVLHILSPKLKQFAQVLKSITTW